MRILTMNKKRGNTFVTLLSLLGVKYTESFSEQYFNEHPHKYNLYGLSKMLTDYGIRNVATRIEDKEKIYSILNVRLSRIQGVILWWWKNFSKGR